MDSQTSNGPGEPLIQSEVNFIHETSHNQSRSDASALTYDQATALILTLENTKNVIQNYVHRLEALDVKKSLVFKRKSWWGRHCFPFKRKWLYRNITIVTVSLQFLNLLVLTLLDAWPKPNKERPFIMASSVTMIILQLINLFFLILASGRLVKQFSRNSVSNLLLAQTYGATILLFAGLYTLTYRLQRHSWRFVNENLNEGPVQVFDLYAKFLFYSISTATLCGSDNVLPVYWYNCLFAAFQMLLSFCYFASILGTTMCHDHAKGPTSLSTLPSVSLQSPQQDHQHHHHYQQQQQQTNNDLSPDPHYQVKTGNEKHTHIVTFNEDGVNVSDNTNQTLTHWDSSLNSSQEVLIHNTSSSQAGINPAFLAETTVTGLGERQPGPIEVEVINAQHLQIKKDRFEKLF